MKAVGAQVFDCGIASTPAMFLTTVKDNNLLKGEVLIAASHSSFNRN
jgi:phosphomannomutase